jgi:hypothetical protein
MNWRVTCSWCTVSKDASNATGLSVIAGTAASPSKKSPKRTLMSSLAPSSSSGYSCGTTKPTT